MKGSDGFRRRTRSLRITPRNRGKLNIGAILAKFEENERVAIKINPSHQKIPHPRFNGRIGKVVGDQGRAYIIEFMDGEKNKRILVTPEHLKRVN